MCKGRRWRLHARLKSLLYAVVVLIDLANTTNLEKIDSYGELVLFRDDVIWNTRTHADTDLIIMPRDSSREFQITGCSPIYDVTVIKYDRKSAKFKYTEKDFCYYCIIDL